METKKYEITKKTKKVDGKNLYRIIALKDFGNVKKGDLGGWIEKEENLSQEGNCWISGDAEVSGDAWIYDNAIIRDNAQVFGNAQAFGNVEISEDAKVYETILWKF